MTHDYKAALADLYAYVEDRYDYELPHWDTMDAIRHALLIADRVMGEPTGPMKAVGATYGLNSRIESTWPDFAAGYWIAMRDQLLREIDDVYVREELAKMGINNG